MPVVFGLFKLFALLILPCDKGLSILHFPWSFVVLMLIYFFLTFEVFVVSKTMNSLLSNILNAHMFFCTRKGCHYEKRLNGYMTFLSYHLCMMRVNI